MAQYSDELEADPVYPRDQWQFEQKDDFLPDPDKKESIYTQEFYIFIPQALQVNSHTYSRSQFYRDQTNLIRFKTPLFTLKEAANLHLSSAPLAKIWKLKEELGKPDTDKRIVNELKLSASVVRSAIRRTAIRLNGLLEEEDYESLIKEVEALKHDITEYLSSYKEVTSHLIEKGASAELKEHLSYINRFSEQSYSQYLIQLISRIHGEKDPQLNKVEALLVSILEKELPQLDIQKEIGEEEGEDFIHQKSILNKYVLDPLLLDINRFSPTKRYQGLAGAFAAAIAMFVYFLLFILWGKVFVINSEPFLLLMIVVYVIKDRLKEGIKDFSYLKRLGWLSDYTTEILSPDEETSLGVLKERVTFANVDEVPEEILKIRNQDFHTVVERFKRPETVINYRRKMTIFEKPPTLDERYFMLNVIFRFNVRHFIEKASNPYHTHLWYDDKSDSVIEQEFPKVYHINIILQSTIEKEGKKPVKELSKFRIVVDKNGIKRIENL